MMIHNDAAAALLHAHQKLFSCQCQHTVYFTEAKIHDSGRNVPFLIVQTCLEVICVQIFSEYELCPYIYFFFFALSILLPSHYTCRSKRLKAWQPSSQSWKTLPRNSTICDEADREIGEKSTLQPPLPPHTPPLYQLPGFHR